MSADNPKYGDWIRITWMEGEPVAQVIDTDDYGNPVIEHPTLPGLAPITVDVFDWICGPDDPRFTQYGDGI